MRKLTLRLIVALFTFLIGITGASLWLFNRQSSHQEVHLDIPEARWEPSFFRKLSEHSEGMNLHKLREVVLPKGDIEVRLWYDLFPDRIDGVILRRSGNRWSAAYLHGTYERQPFRIERKSLAAPKSGWGVAWDKLEKAGILTLPDASEVGCHSGALDGVSYVVETNTNMSYRTYSYGNPQLARCSEARQMVEIAEIMEEEFDMWNPKNWE